MRKVDPLHRALKGVNVWITVLRGSQSYFREQIQVFEFDSSFGLIKFNPMIHWSFEEVITYLNQNNVFQNNLYSKGFASIGCASCT